MKDNETIEIKPEKIKVENILLLSKTLNEYCRKEDNSDFAFLYKKLLQFRRLKQKNIENKTPIPFDEFQTETFLHLESLLTEAVLLLQKNERDNRIKKTKYWFLKTFSTIDSIANIKIKTTKDKNQVFKEEEVEAELLQQINKTSNDVDEENKKHRDCIEGFEEPAFHLKKYTTKVVFPPKIVKDLRETDSYFGHDSNIDNTKVMQRINSEIHARSTFYATRTDSTFYKANYIGSTAPVIGQDGSYSSRFDPSKEVKSNYSFNRPKYHYDQLSAERAINANKQKTISEIRHITEVNEVVKAFGLNKALFQQRLNKKKEMKEMISNYKGVIKENQKKHREEMLRLAKEKKLKALIDQEKKREELRLEEEGLYEEEEEETKEKDKQNDGDTIHKQKTMKSNYESRKRVVIEEQEKVTIKPLEDKVKRLPKHTIANVKYITVTPGPNERVIIIKCKMTRLKILNMNNIEMIKRNIEERDNALNDDNNDNLTEINLPTDIRPYTDRHHKILKYRAFNSTLCNVKLIDNPKDSYKKTFKPLSLFDTLNKNETTPAKGRNHPKLRSGTIDFLYDSYQKNNDDYLNLRKTLTVFNESQIKSSKHKRNSSYKHTMQTAFANPDRYNTISPLSNLPKAGSRLLCLP